MGPNPYRVNQEPRTIIDTWRENWPAMFLVGYLLSAIISNTRLEVVVEQIEIHYRLFIMMMLATLSFGGFALSILPWPAAVLICALVVGFHRRSQYFGRIVK